VAAVIKHRGQRLQPSAIAVLMAEAAGWRPEKDDELEGVVLGVKIGTSTFGEYPIVFVLPDGDDSDPVAIHGFHEVLMNEIIGQRPEQGDRFFCKFLGPKEGWEGPKGYDPPMIYATLVTKPDSSQRSVYDGFRRRGEADKGGSASAEQFADKPPF
jgi:hypothetical protein